MQKLLNQKLQWLFIFRHQKYWELQSFCRISWIPCTEYNFLHFTMLIFIPSRTQCTTYHNMYNLWIMPKQRTYMFCTILTTHTDHFPKHHKLNSFWDGWYSLWDTEFLNIT
jgi:hypothetical protein